MNSRWEKNLRKMNVIFEGAIGNASKMSISMELISRVRSQAVLSLLHGQLYDYATK